MIQVVLINFAKFTGKHRCQCLFLNKETLAALFSCESREIYNNTFFTEHLLWLLLSLWNADSILDWIMVFNRGSVQKQPAELFYKEKVFLKISQNAQENTCTRLSFLIKSLTQVFSCEFCEISYKTFFTEHLWATASERLEDLAKNLQSEAATWGVP